MATTYAHTQRGPLHWLLWGTAGIMVTLSVVAWSREPDAAIVLACGAALPAFLSFCFMHLTVRDEGEALRIRFGPLGLFQRSVPYATMRGAQASRSSIIDGWGVHWIPGRGWTWNLWGRDCVEIRLTDGRMRIGTDDVGGLLGFLQARIPERSA